MTRHLHPYWRAHSDDTLRTRLAALDPAGSTWDANLATDLIAELAHRSRYPERPFDWATDDPSLTSEVGS